MAGCLSCQLRHQRPNVFVNFSAPEQQHADDAAADEAGTETGLLHRLLCLLRMEAAADGQDRHRPKDNAAVFVELDHDAFFSKRQNWGTPSTLFNPVKIVIIGDVTP